MSKVFDVRKPGTAPAHPSGKPIVIPDKPQVQDPSITVNGIGDGRPTATGGRKIEIRDHAEVAQAAPAVTAVLKEEEPEPVPEVTDQEEVQAIADAAMEGSVEIEIPKEDTQNPFGAPVPQPVQQQGSGAKTALMIFLILLLAVVIFDMLLDVGVLDLNVPHTNFF